MSESENCGFPWDGKSRRRSSHSVRDGLRVGGAELAILGFVGRIALGIGCAATFVFVLPHARDSGAILAAESDPAALSESQLRTVARPQGADVAREIDAA